MATASIELALWKPPRHAHAAGYVCTTLRAVIGVNWDAIAYAADDLAVSVARVCY